MSRRCPALDLRHLCLIEAIVEHGTLTQAAEHLRLTQSAASQQLKEAERRLGTNLFNRVGRGLELAAAGESVLDAARVALDAIRQAEDDVRAIAEGQAGVLRLSIECYTSYQWLPDFLSRYAKMFPDVTVQLQPGVTTNPVEALRRQMLDVAVVVDPEDQSRAKPDPSIALTPLFEDEAVAVVPRSHPWSTRAFVTANDFSSEVLLAMRDPARDALARRVLDPAGVSPQRVLDAPTATGAITDAVRAGLGIAVMARWAAAPHLSNEELVAVRVTPEGLWRQWSAATRREPLPAYVGEFVALLASRRPCAVNGRFPFSNNV